ncbi:MAG TPA: hypothetical protein VFG23_18880 [Polyangia bacterium]|nr:hypothetical protein [Polyangia bacterium]
MSGPANPPAIREGSGRSATTGRFQPGNLANPSGRPKDVHGIGELARSYAPEAIERLVVLARGRGSAAVAACKELLDRGLGKAPQAIDATIRRGGPDALGGQPDAARQRIEQMILDAQAGAMAVLEHVADHARPSATVPQTVALPEETEQLPALGETEAADVAKTWPIDPPEGGS